MNDALRFAALFCLFAFVGCVPPPPRDPPATSGSSTKTEATPIDELTLGFESIRAINSPAAIERTMSGAIERRQDGTINNSQITKSRGFLNQWLSRQDIDAVPWKLDPMFRNMPRAIREHPQFSSIERLDYLESDILYLQQCLWLSDIAQRVTKEPAAPQLAGWFTELEKAEQIVRAAKLRQAERLFDWTVRNIQLEPLLPVPKGPESTVTAGSDGKLVTPIAERILEPGPGYLQRPQQTLQRGRGDAWERARIFIQLCRQAEIEACMLATIKEGEPAPLPWLAAVVLEGEFYLFDPQLGLPIPGPNKQGIATLTQFIADGQLLAQLSPSDGPAYPVTAADLKAIAVVIEAQPEALSRRMTLLEAPLNAARQQSRTERIANDDADSLFDIVLTTRPSELQPKLQKMKHVSTVGLWRVPFEAELFQQQLRSMEEAARKDPKLMTPYLAQHFLEEDVLQMQFELFQGRDGVDRSLVGNQQQKSRAPRKVTLLQGRDYLLRSRWDNDETRIGARPVFLSCRTPDHEIEPIEKSPAHRRKIFANYPGLPTNPRERDEAIEYLQNSLLQSIPRIRMAKDDGTYWLGMTYFEEGNFANAIEWLAPLLRNRENGMRRSSICKIVFCNRSRAFGWRKTTAPTGWG